MHANLDVWWSQATMAYFWGMYINGIAVYGRDPVLTCEYAHFVTEDQGCPAVFMGHKGTEWTLEEVGSMIWNGYNVRNSNDLHPSDWRNCSSQGYHP